MLQYTMTRAVLAVIGVIMVTSDRHHYARRAHQRSPKTARKFSGHSRTTGIRSSPPNGYYGTSNSYFGIQMYYSPAAGSSAMKVATVVSALSRDGAPLTLIERARMASMRW